MTAGIGDAAPDFTLKATTGDEVALSQFRDDYTPFEAAGAQVLAISCDPAPSQKMWADQEGWTFPVLTDFWPHGEVAKA